MAAGSFEDKAPATLDRQGATLPSIWGDETQKAEPWLLPASS